MKILGYEFRKFEKKVTTIGVVETWCVKWVSLIHGGLRDRFPDVEVQVQAFPSEDTAKFFKKELEDAMKLLGHKGWAVNVYLQKMPTNK